LGEVVCQEQLAALAHEGLRLSGRVSSGYARLDQAQAGHGKEDAQGVHDGSPSRGIDSLAVMSMKPPNDARVSVARGNSVLE
jgi:hypothetical protein